MSMHTPRTIARSIRLAALLPLGIASGAVGCASLGGGRAAPSEDRDRVITVQARDSRDVVVLAGAPVQMRSGTFDRRGDSTVVRGTAVALLPDGPFELHVRTAPDVRGRVVLQFSTIDSVSGRVTRVHAEGRDLVVRRDVDARGLTLDGESIDVRNWPARRSPGS